MIPALQPAQVPWHRRAGSAMGRFLSRLVLGRDVTEELLADRARLSSELSRRLAELHSLQELAQVLSASMRFDTVVAEVARYAMRALDASGAVVLLAPEHGAALEVVAAKGVLAGHMRRRIDPESGGLVLGAMAHERVERSASDGPLELFPGATARCAVAAPLRAHGVTVGAIAVADKLIGTFTADDARLLSTAATHAAVVLANARFFELVRVGKEQWEATFDALTEGIALIGDDGLIRRANRALAGLIGQTIPAAIGRHLDQDLFGDRAALQPLIADAHTRQQAGTTVQRSAKLGRTLRLSASPLPSPTGEVAAVVVVEDITEQQALEGQLLQSEKLAAVGTLVSGVAHELNNPLTSIAGLSEFLLEQGVGDQTQREHLRVINDQSERASRIVRNLLSFARSSPAERSELDLGDIAQRTVMLMSYETRRAGAVVDVATAADLPAVLGNRDQVQQVLLNLLTNATHAVAQVPKPGERRITVRVAVEAGRVVTRVADSGPGVPADAAPRIFDPFYTTKPPGEGTGLGLFLSYGIAESHGGSLTLEPAAAGGGAEFAFALPPAVALPARPSGPRAVPPGAGRRRVLVVDDDPAMRRLVMVLFGHDGHTVDAAPGGAEAIELVRQHAYDMVITDRHAAAGGEPFATALRRERPTWQERIIVSAADRPSGAGADEFQGLRVLRKPFNLRDLRAAASSVFAAV